MAWTRVPTTPYNDQTGNVLALTLARCCSVLDKLLVYFDDEAVIGGLTSAEKERLLGRVAIVAGITFDKLRLQTGKSTSNNSHQIQVNQVHKALTFTTASSESGSSGEGPQQRPTS